MVITQLINAITKNEEKLKIPIRTNIFHLVACGNCPNMEIGTITPTTIDKTKVILKDPKSPFPLITRSASRRPAFEGGVDKCGSTVLTALSLLKGGSG